MESLARMMSRELNMVPKDNESDVLKTTAAEIVHDSSQLTPLQLAYQKQKNSVFFGKFPPEVRNKIYAQLLVADEVIAVGIDEQYAAEEHDIGYQGPYEDFNRETVLHGTIARTCRLSVYESYPILYGGNVFLFSDRGQMYWFEIMGMTSDLV